MLRNLIGYWFIAGTVLAIIVLLIALCAFPYEAGLQAAQGGSVKPAGFATEQQAEPKPEEATEDNAELVEGIIEEQDRPESEKTEEVAEDDAKLEEVALEEQVESEPEPEKAEEATEDDAEPTENATERQAEPEAEPEKPEEKGGSDAEGQPLVTNMFYDTSVRQALSDISAQTGVIILPDISVQGIVTCELQDIPLQQALRIVLSSGNFVFRQMDGYILVGSADSESPSFSMLSETRRMKMNCIKAEEAVKMLLEPMQKYASTNATSNTVSVTAPPLLLERIVSDLRLFDQPSRHVMLDARVVAMQRRDLLNLGVQWDWPTISAGIFSDSEHHGGGSEERVHWPWGIQVGYTPGKEFTNSLQLTLNLLTQNDEATVTSSPQLMAQDGQESEIKVATEEYFKITQESAYYTRFELETIETGTTLTITPRIGDNNEITLDISAEVSDVIARGEDNLPVVTRRTTKNTVRLEDGGTAAIAGLIDSRTQIQKHRAPGLAGIPIFGQLFRNSAGYKSSRQVAVFVTARLMPEQGLVRQEPVEERTPIEPVGEEFRAALQEALSTLSKRNRKP